MKKIYILTAVAIIFASCGGGTKPEETSNEPISKAQKDAQAAESTPSYDPNRGEGKFNSTNVIVSDKLNLKMAESGEMITGVKCASCHKLSDEKLVGPGWKGVTERRTPEWIMNFITDPDPMIDKDPAVQAQYEICLVRMPNQGLSEEDSRNILEFMRKNDGIK